jgi:hypothetical protein
MDDKKTYKKSETLRIQERDLNIFKFLDRAGYANQEQITRAICGNSDEKSQAAILRRLYLLRRFEYLAVFSTQKGVYYVLTRKSKLENALITSIKLDQLPHHDFLIDLFFCVQNEQVLSERECIAAFKVVGKKGKVPDMVINDWIIEFERTNKSTADCKSVVDYWTVEQGKNLCVICETVEIQNRYANLANSKVSLIPKKEYQKILSTFLHKGLNNVNDSLNDVKNKYS